MDNIILPEKQYKEIMDKKAIPLLTEHRRELWLERESGKRIYCACYLADRAKGVVLISHGFTETAEKYLECIYYFLMAGYHVYCMEHCGHGHSYRLTQDLSLVHIDCYERYIEDFLFMAKIVKKEQEALPVYLYAHSMGGGIGAAAAAWKPEYFDKLILSSPMIRPLTKPVPWILAKMIAQICCAVEKSEKYVAGQSPYKGTERFEESASTSRERFEYYQEKRAANPMYQMNAASYGWLRSAGKLNRYLRFAGWKRISVPVLLFQAGQDAFVSNREQERFIKKISRNGKAQLVKIPGAKHELYNAKSDVLERYWKEIFSFLEA